jgi:hypothetical protein
MPLGAAYATILELETRLGRSNDGSFDELLDAASRAIESFTRRQFNKATSPTARQYRAVDPERLPVDDFHTTTGLAISVDGTAWDLTDVELRPINGVVNGQTGWPFSDLLTVGRIWPAGRRARVTVTAQWGWAAVPEAITQATLDLAEIMSYGSSSTGVVRSTAIDGYSVTYETPQLSAGSIPAEFVKAAPYRRMRFGVA